VLEGLVFGKLLLHLAGKSAKAGVHYVFAQRPYQRVLDGGGVLPFGQENVRTDGLFSPRLLTGLVGRGLAELPDEDVIDLQSLGQVLGQQLKKCLPNGSGRKAVCQFFE
jgi:hypothetical protein